MNTEFLSGEHWSATTNWWALVLLHSLWVGIVAAVLVVIVHRRLLVVQTTIRYGVAVLSLFAVPVASMILAQVPLPMETQLFWSMPQQSHSSADPDLTATMKSHGDLSHGDTSHAVSSEEAVDVVSKAGSVTPTVSSRSSAEVSLAGRSNRWWNSVRQYVVALWLVGFGCMLIRLVRSHMNAWALRSQPEQSMPVWLQQMFGELTELFGVAGR
ncbi:MAG: hypothetical protein KDA96_13470, partial [Planctomycetaceae bacterium]|nr:hypothetical protein [Planctomycetaceae bacterium]